MGRVLQLWGVKNVTFKYIILTNTSSLEDALLESTGKYPSVINRRRTQYALLM